MEIRPRIVSAASPRGSGRACRSHVCQVQGQACDPRTQAGVPALHPLPCDYVSCCHLWASVSSSGKTVTKKKTQVAEEAEGDP